MDQLQLRAARAHPGRCPGKPGALPAPSASEIPVGFVERVFAGVRIRWVLGFVARDP